MAILDSVIARRPDTADAYISLAHAYWEAGQPQLAIATLEKALANGAPDRDMRIRLGIYLAESQRRSRHARSSCSKACPTSDVEALNGLGVAYGDAGRYDDAMRAFGRVLALDPTNGLAYQNLASMVLQAGAGGEERSDRREAPGSRDATRARRSTSIPHSPALHDARRHPRRVRAQGRRDRQLEARRRARRSRVQRALQPVVRARVAGRRLTRRSRTDAVRGDCAARAIWAGDRADAEVPGRRLQGILRGHGEETCRAKGCPGSATSTTGGRRFTRAHRDRRRRSSPSPRSAHGGGCARQPCDRCQPRSQRAPRHRRHAAC